MANLKDVFQSIGTAIHRITGNTTKLTPSQFATEIDKMAYVDNGKITGKVSRTEIATPSIQLNSSKGLITATVTQDQTGVVSSGSKSQTLQLKTVSGTNVTPSTTDKTVVGAGSYVSGNIVVKGDEDLRSENIMRGVSVFNVTGSADMLREMQRYKDENFYGTRATEVAKSYHTAFRKGGVTFVYSDTKGLLIDGALTDENGNCYMNSTLYTALILRGIYFADSPFAKVAGTANKTINNTPGIESTVLSDLNKGDIYLDMQTRSDLTHSLKANYKSIITAGQQAEYYYQLGCVLHEYSVGNPPTSLPSDVRAGDMIFWSDGSDSTQFRGVTQSGIFAHNTKFIHHINKTGDEIVTIDYFTDCIDNIVLIVRPDYRPTQPTDTPIGINLLQQYAFDSLTQDNSRYWNGNAFIPQDTGGFGVQVYDANNHTVNTTFYICDNDHPLILSPGTYKLSGCPVHRNISSTGTSILWGLGIETLDGNIVPDINGVRTWDRGAGATFKLTETTKICVYFYVSASLKETSPYLVVPRLVRQS